MKTIFQFCKDSISSFFCTLTNTDELSNVQKKSIALICIAIAVILSYFEYSYTTLGLKIFDWQLFDDRTNVLEIKPKFFTVAIAVFLILPHYIRNRTAVSFYSITMLILNIMFFASIISVFVSGDTWSIPIINISSQSILFTAILLSWIGMRSLAGVLWIAILVLFIFRMNIINVAMDFNGVLYVISASISIICQMLDASTSYVQRLSNDFFTIKDIIKEDALETKKFASGR